MCSRGRRYYAFNVQEVGLICSYWNHTYFTDLRKKIYIREMMVIFMHAKTILRKEVEDTIFIAIKVEKFHKICIFLH